MSNAEAATSTLLDIRTFVSTMRGERFSSFVIHGTPLGKSTFARRLAETESGLYVDVLARVAEDKELSKKVDILDEAWLEELAREVAKSGASLLVLDEWEFLIPVWGSDITPFLQRLARLHLPCVVAWVLTTRPKLEEANLQRADGVSRVLKLEEIQAI